MTAVCSVFYKRNLFFLTLKVPLVENAHEADQKILEEDSIRDQILTL